MNIKKFFGFFILLWISLAFAKVWLLNGEIFTNATLQHFVFYAIVCLITVALFRRFGIITYIETILALIFYILGGIFLDLIVTSNYTTLSLFKNEVYWIGYVVMILAAMVFHKKRHIYLRKELHAQHHAHAHTPEHKAHGDHHQQPHGQHSPGKQHH